MSEPPPAADEGCATGMLKALGLMIFCVLLLGGFIVLAIIYFRPPGF